MAGGGRFRMVGRSLIAQPGNGIGLLYYVGDQFDDFTLTLDFCLPHPRGTSNDNSGVFVRFRDPRKPVLPGTQVRTCRETLRLLLSILDMKIQIDEEARGDTRKKEPDGRPEQDRHFYNRTGAIYKVQTLGAALGQQKYTNNQQLTPGIWHSYEIKVTGHSYEVKLNGLPATAFTADPADPVEKFRGRKKSEDPDSGFIGLQVHTGVVASPISALTFKTSTDVLIATRRDIPLLEIGQECQQCSAYFTRRRLARPARLRSVGASARQKHLSAISP